MYPACRICWKLSSVLLGKVSTGSCHTLAAAHWEAGRSHLLGDALPMAFLMKPLHGCWPMGAAEPMHSKSGMWKKQGNDAGKAPWAEGLSREEQPQPRMGFLFFLHPDTLSTTKSQRLSS